MEVELADVFVGRRVSDVFRQIVVAKSVGVVLLLALFDEFFLRLLAGRLALPLAGLQLQLAADVFVDVVAGVVELLVDRLRDRVERLPLFRRASISLDRNGGRCKGGEGGAISQIDALSPTSAEKLRKAGAAPLSGPA